MNGFTLRDAALQDLEEIWLYTFQHWGAEQADRYLRALFERCKWLAKNPALGKARDDIKAGYSCFPEGRHLVFYKRSTTGIEVIGFPHHSMDVVKYFE